MNIPLSGLVTFDVITISPTTGSVSDADTTPTFAVYEETTDTDIGVGGNMTKRTSLTGNYRGQFTASAANGFEAGKMYNVIASATVGSIAGKSRALVFRCIAAENTAGYPLADTAKVSGTTQTARDLGLSVLVGDKTGFSLSSGGVQAIWDALTSALTTTSSIGKLLVDNINATISSRSTYAGADTAGTTTLLSRLGAALTITSGKVDVNDKTGFSLSSGGVQAIWDALTSALTTVGSIGKRLSDDIDATISSRSTYSGGAVASVTAAVTVGTNNDKTGYGLSAAAIQAVWDALTTALTTVGSVGKLLIDNINATIGSRSTYSGGAVASVTAPVTVGTNNDKTGYALTVTPPTAVQVRSEMDSNSIKLAHLDADISTRSTYAGGAVASVTAAVTVGTNNDKGGYSLTSGERTSIANEVEAQIIDDTDSEKVLQAIVDKIASINPSLGDLTLSAIASAIRTELTTELGRIDTTISSRNATTPPTVSAIRTEMDTNSTKLAHLDVDVSTRSTYAGADPAGLTTLLGRLTASRAGYLDVLNGLISAIWGAADKSGYTLTSAYDPAKTASQAGNKMDLVDVPNSVAVTAIQTGLALQSLLLTVAGYIDTEIAAIKSKTDGLPASPAAVADIPTAAQIVDKLLGRNLAGGSDGGRMVKDSLRANRNKVSITSGTMRVYAEDDTTVAWQAAVTTDGAADPITVVDPA